MKLLCITDLHGDTAALDSILAHAGAIDMVLLGGDITNFGTPNAAECLVKRTQEVCPSVLAVAGNCDSAAIDERLIELDVSLFGRGIMIGGLGFYGVSAMPPWHGHMYELTEKHIANALESGRQQLDQSCREILVTHTPPRNTRLDATRHGEHVGSSSVREFIELTRPALVICGHIHESRGVDRLGRTQMVNCGTAFRGQYALVEAGTDVKIELHTAE